MRKRSILLKIITFVMCVVSLLNFPINTPAATQGGRNSTTINVTTKSVYWYPGASSITLSQDKQTMTFLSLSGKRTKTKTGYYGHYDIYIYNKTKQTNTHVKWYGGRSKKIKLDPNCTYSITVSYSQWLSLCVNPPFGYGESIISQPSWWVSSKWKVSSCS